LKAFQGFLYPSTNVVIGLFARSLWILSDALSQLTKQNPLMDCTAYIEYFASINHVLLAIAGSQYKMNVLGTNSAIFWIAAETLKCNKENQSIIFDTAMEVILFHISAQIEFSQRVFRKFHQPWHEHFAGFVSLICNYEGQNISLCIRALNLIVQSKLAILFNSKENWLYVCLLLLLPWIWKIVMTDLSRFTFTSEEAELVEGTLAQMKSQLLEKEIQVSLDSAIEGQESIFYDSINDLFTIAFGHVDQEDISLIIQFYTLLLKNGDKSLKIPLYTLATLLLEISPESINKFTKFANLVKDDVKDRTLQLQARFLEKIPIDLITPTEVVDLSFPFLKLTEKIVVVDVPHLYEIDALNERTALCIDLNSFIPVCLMDPAFLVVEKVQKIRESLENVDLAPFQKWSRMIADGMTFLYGERQIVKHVINVQKLQGIRLDVPILAIECDDEIVEESEVQEEEIVENVQSTSCLDLVIIGPDVFIPAMDVVNSTGAEYLEHILVEE